MKKCTKCFLYNGLENFYIYTHSNGKKYHKSVCKECFTKLSKPYIKKWSSKEEVKLAKNEKRRKFSSLIETKEKKKKQARKYLENNKEKILLSNAKRRARKLNLPFNLKLEDIIIPEFCPILEIPIITGTRNNYENSASLDRIIPEKGYVSGNVNVISSLANTMKNSANFELLKKFSKNILKYIINHDIVRTAENMKSVELKDKEPLG